MRLTPTPQPISWLELKLHRDRTEVRRVLGGLEPFAFCLLPCLFCWKQAWKGPGKPSLPILPPPPLNVLSLFLKDFIYLFLERGEGKEKERERNISVWLLLMCPVLGTWPATQACALDWEWTPRPSCLQALALNPLSYASQG